ncbi:MAG TPA: response regulator, partial [Rhodanobacter sp.]|nr:response regulator [Rhodanobacter sp.]
IVMISGNVQATEQFYVQRYGADDFMKKPFGRAEVFERVQQLVLAGRLPARTSTGQPLPPNGVSQDEWDAIPDIAMPDEPLGVYEAISKPEDSSAT